MLGPIDNNDPPPFARALLAAEGGAPRSLNVDARDVFQAPLICRAARSGHSGVVRVLVEAGADATAMNYGDLRKTAIHYAVLRSDLLTIEVRPSYSLSLSLFL